jgi:hypothetical protein
VPRLLGSELISSDIIAFYELIKNAFDAGSTTGAVISFDVVIRRNSYLRLRNRDLEHLATVGKDSKLNRSLTDEMKAGAARALDVSAGTASVEAFNSIIDGATDLRTYVAALDEAYATMNTITIADTGSGMSLDELSEFPTPSTQSAGRVER